MKSYYLSVTLPFLLLTLSCGGQTEIPFPEEEVYKDDWTSLQKHPEAEWFHDAKFGIYTHWGAYAVPAYGNEWYPRWMYAKGHERNGHYFEHHQETWGLPTEFGYKDFVPLFTAEKFDADEWAELFQLAGARFAGPVAEHHDGFAMWDSDLTDWDVVDRGPRRDITGELADAIRRRGMKFVTSFHHAQKWWHFQDSYSFEDVDTKNEDFAHINGIYPPPHEADDRPTESYLIHWEAKVKEVIDRYEPDYLWFDFGWSNPEFEPYKRSLLAYYYNKERAWNRDVVVTYKHDHLPPGAGILDLERGKIDSLTTFKWITDTSISYNSWCYTDNLEYNSLNTLIDNLVDRVSKNGNLLLNVAPRADGSIPEEQKELLMAMGEWLKANGEAIYDTRPWFTYGEGPTVHESGQFKERGIADYTSEDIRFTRNGNVLFATVLAWPASDTITVKTLRSGVLSALGNVEHVVLLSTDSEVVWDRTGEGLIIELPDGLDRDEPAFSFKILVSGSLDVT